MSKPGERLWRLIQGPQGHATITDAIEEWELDRVLSEAERAARWHAECAGLLRSFVKSYKRQKRGKR